MNKNTVLSYLKAATLGTLLLTFYACGKKDEKPTSSTPLVITNSAAWIGPRWAILKGQINGRNLMTTVTFQYDTTQTYNIVVSPAHDTTSGSTLVSFSYTLTGLKPNTKYHYRASATNSSGTGLGADVAFITKDTLDFTVGFNKDLTYDSIYDIEGNKYHTIQIGSQTWTAENLKTTKYNDGTDISFSPDVLEWYGLTTAAYTFYNSDSLGYGAMYNWYAVESGKLCPSGWHVPSDDEFTALTDYLGGMDVAGGKLKETGTAHWLTPNTDATNESGFSAVPGGYRNFSGTYNSITNYAYWWTSTELTETGAWYRDVYYAYSAVDRSNTHKRTGASVRCVKD